MQGCANCKENKKEKELEKNDYPLIFFGWRIDFAMLQKNNDSTDSEKTLQNDRSQHKGTSGIKIIWVCVCQASFGCSHRNEH